jgi:hypothetical protein
MVDGKPLYKDGQLQTIDEPAVIREIQATVATKRNKVGFS